MMRWIFRALLFAFALFLCGTAYCKVPVLVVYPEADASLQHIYNAVITGIDHQVGSTTQLILTPDMNNLQASLDHLQPEHIIALSKTAAEAVRHSSYHDRLWVGMMAFTHPDYRGVSLTLDSKRLAQQVAQFAPFIKRFFVVQEARNLSVILNDKAAASSSKAIKFKPANENSNEPDVIIREGVDMITTIRLLGHLVEQEATTRDAVLLPVNLPNDILYEISRIAWDRHIILLSTNLYHLENGALMVLYPDPVALGEQLGLLVAKKNAQSESLQGLKAALNKLIARHLNLDFDEEALQHFEVTIK